MGREIRRVLVDWEHPKKQVPDWRTGRMVEQFQPMYDRDFETAMQGWLNELQEWTNGEFARVLRENPDCNYKPTEPYRAFCEWNGTAPDPDYYRPRWADDAVLGFAVYETVSEGTPVTPAFATKDELINYLMNHGTYWDDGRPWSRAAAEGFVEAEYSVSMVVANGQVIMPNDEAMYQLGKKDE